MINSIDKVYEDNISQGGIVNFGNFNEGFCVKINTLKPAYSWIFCLETESEKDSFMDKVRALKIEKQRKNGEFILNQESKKETFTNIFNIENSNNNKNNTNIIDGHWIILQDWSQCDKACGGGISTLHRMCIPPKNGGKECEGQPIMTKPCNINPCPGVLTNGTDSNNTLNNTSITLKPIIKILPFSNKPQRYTKCVIKEGDLMIQGDTNLLNIKNNPSYAIKEDDNIKIPTRAVMNNLTITFFTGVEYETHVISFNLKDTKFLRKGNETGCFVLIENDKRIDVCPFGCENVKKVVEEWDYDFHLFQNQCNNKEDVITVDIDYDKKLKEMMVCCV